MIQMPGEWKHPVTRAGTEQHVRLVTEDVFGAIAVMHSALLHGMECNITRIQCGRYITDRILIFRKNTT